MTREQAREAIESVARESLAGDPDDLATFASGLLHWVASSGEDDDGLDEAFEVVRYLSEIPETAGALLELLSALVRCRELAGRETIVLMIEEALAWASADAAGRASRVLLGLLVDDPDPKVRYAAVGGAWTLFSFAPGTDAWRRALSQRVADAEDEKERAAALVALARAGGAKELATRLVRELPEEPSLLHHAVGLALRFEGTRDPDAMRFRDRHGQPGSLRLLFRRLGLPGDAEDVLPELEPNAPAAPLEHAEVVFAGALLVQVRHPERGPFTLRIPGAGLAKGDPVWLGEFVEAPARRPLLAKWRADGVEHELRFALDGSPKAHA